MRPSDPHQVPKPELGPTPVRARSLGSGSSGNALLLEAGERRILIDCGMEPFVVRRRLADAGVALNQIDAVCISHEHLDHARALRALVVAGLPVVATAGTARACHLDSKQAEIIVVGRPASIAGWEIQAIPVSHDAAEPCGFTVALGPARVTIATDLGQPDRRLVEAMRASDLIVLEANHDVELLRHGPYPARLKRRILSSRGHLSNATSAAMLAEALRGGERRPFVWLAHLSQTNNRPALAISEVQRFLARQGVQPPIDALGRHGGEMWSSNPAARPPVQLPLRLP